MKFDMNKWGPATFLVVALVTIITVGGLLDVLLKDDMSFESYLNLLIKAAAAPAVLALGRGVSNGLKNQGKGTG